MEGVDTFISGIESANYYRAEGDNKSRSLLTFIHYTVPPAGIAVRDRFYAVGVI